MAAEHFEVALEQDPTYAKPRYYRALAKLQLGEVSEVTAMLEELATREDNYSAEVQSRLAELSEDSCGGASIDHYRQNLVTVS